MLQMKCRRWKPGNAQGFLLSIKPVQMPPLTDVSLCATASERGHTSPHAGWEKVEIAEMIVISSLPPFFFFLFFITVAKNKWSSIPPAIISNTNTEYFEFSVQMIMLTAELSRFLGKRGGFYSSGL